MKNKNVFEVVPWPINGVNGLGAVRTWPSKTKFVCSYVVSIGVDIIEEALFSVTAGTRGTIDSLWTITAYNLPREHMRDGTSLIADLKYKYLDITYGRVCRRHVNNKNRVEGLEEMVSEFLKIKIPYETPKHFIARGIFSERRFKKILKSVQKEKRVVTNRKNQKISSW